MNTQTTRLLGTIVASLLCSGIASAEPERSADAQRTVHFAHADPTTPAGARKIYEQITAAAREICGTGTGRGRSIAALAMVEQANLCTANAVDTAVRRVNATAHVDLEYLAGVARANHSTAEMNAAATR
jgi:UrcA family protein